MLPVCVERQWQILYHLTQKSVVFYSTSDYLNFGVFNYTVWHTNKWKSDTNSAVVIHPLFLISARLLRWVHFSNPCKSLVSCFNEPVVHLFPSLSPSLSPSPSLCHSSPPCSLSLPIDKSKWANTESLHLRLRPSITATCHNSLNSNAASHCRVNKKKHVERKEVN